MCFYTNFSKWSGYALHTRARARTYICYLPSATYWILCTIMCYIHTFHSIRAVSYTHLDVYKRQVHWLWTVMELLSHCVCRSRPDIRRGDFNLHLCRNEEHHSQYSLILGGGYKKDGISLANLTVDNSTAADVFWERRWFPMFLQDSRFSWALQLPIAVGTKFCYYGICPKFPSVALCLIHWY